MTENWVSVITGDMDKDDPDSILNAIYLTVLNGSLCPLSVDKGDRAPCPDCAVIWDAISYRMQKDTCPECHITRGKHAPWCDR